MRRTAAVLVLAFTLATPGAWAGETRPQAESAGILQQVWSWLTALWNLPLPGAEAPSTDEGWDIDPWGSQSCSSTDVGPGMDPLGCPRPSTDEGWSVDPWG